MKLAFIDVDGIIADSTERFNRARAAKQNYLLEARNNPVMVENFSKEKESIKIYWKVAFTPELIALDTLIVGAVEAINSLEDKGYNIFFLSSRPETLRGATIVWLAQNGVYQKRPGAIDKLLLKPLAAQFTRTTVWKASTIQLITAMYEALEVFVIDDEAGNREEIINSALDFAVDHRISCFATFEKVADFLKLAEDK